MKLIFSTALALASLLALGSARASPQTPADTCVAACAPEDVSCKAKCVGVPHPDRDSVLATTECAMNCDQGDGSAAATSSYAACQKRCESTFYLTSETVGVAAPTPVASVVSSAVSALQSAASGAVVSAASSAAASASSALQSSLSAVVASVASAASGVSASISASVSASQSAVSALASSSSVPASPGAASSNMQFGASTLGLAGMVVALFAL